MNPETQIPSTPSAEAAIVAVRRTIEALNSLDPETADHLSALAFVMMRVARADGIITADERRSMEAILVEHAGIPAAHAAIVTEIAGHRTEIADCGCSYSISRGLRAALDETRRRSIIGLLSAVAEADGSFSSFERHEVAQLAGELGIRADDVAES